MKAAAVIGIDIGTSGVRAVALDDAGDEVGSGTFRFATAEATADPAQWWLGVETALSQLAALADLGQTKGIAVDGTSGTMLAIDAQGTPLAPAAMYNAPVGDPLILAAIDRHAPPASPARGAASPLGKAIALYRALKPDRVVHQADWVAMQLASGAVLSDENNALKSGYDLETASWPVWIEAAGMPIANLPEVRPAGSSLALVGPHARALGLPTDCQVFAGTTDGCASFLATGASVSGDGVTALGSSLVLKLLCDHRIDAPQFGIYSHRILGMWLAGGASNTGGAVIRALLPNADLDQLTAQIDPDRPTDLAYYPLLRPGERFPVSDPHLPPRLTPRPDNDVVFFQAILEGIADIEAAGFRKLRELGAPSLTSVRTVGGGAVNQPWQRIRRAKLGVSVLPARSVDAAAGVARLALQGVRHG